MRLDTVKAEILADGHLEQLCLWLERGLRERTAGGDISDGGETHIEYRGGTLMSYSAHVGYLGVMGGKLLSATDTNSGTNIPYIHAATILMQAEDGKFRAILDAGLLTAVRTACVSAVAAKYCSTPRQKFGIVGTGLQALAHVLTLRQMGFQPGFVVGHSIEKAKAFAQRLRNDHDVNILPLESTADLCNRVNFVITTTSAREPLLKLRDLNRNTLLIVVGRFEPGRWEVDQEIAYKSRLVVDSRQKFLNSWRNLQKPDEIRELGELICGDQVAETNATDRITQFKPMGMGIFDVIAAKYALDNDLCAD